MTPANILARINGKDQIDKEEIDEVRDLFLDAKSSATLLKQEDAKYMKWSRVVSSPFLVSHSHACTRSMHTKEIFWKEWNEELRKKNSHCRTDERHRQRQQPRS